MLILYQYKALNAENNLMKNFCYAQSEEGALLMLAHKGFSVVHIVPKKQYIKNSLETFSHQFFVGLSSLVSNNIDIVSALEIVSSAIKKAVDRAVVENIVFNIKNGVSFSKTLQNFDVYFDSIVIKTIEIAERTARLSEAIKNIVSHIESKIKIKNEIKNSLRYPKILCTVIFFVMIFWMFFVIPIFGEIFDDIGVPLPFVTVCVLAIRNFCIDYYVLLCALFGALCFWKKHSKKQFVFVKKFKRDQMIYNFFAGVEIMLKEHVDLLESIACVSESVGSCEIVALKNFIENGSTLSQSMGLVNIFHNEEIYIVEAGERAGDLWGAFQVSSEMLKAKIVKRTQKIMSLMQPISVILIGVFVAMIVFSVLMPMYSKLDMNI